MQVRGDVNVVTQKSKDIAKTKWKRLNKIINGCSNN